MHELKVADCLAKVRASKAGLSTKLALEFLVLAAARSGEVRTANWGEIDLKNNVWEIPASRMKMKKPHRVPLPPHSRAPVDKLGSSHKLRCGVLSLVLMTQTSARPALYTRDHAMHPKGRTGHPGLASRW